MGSRAFLSCLRHPLALKQASQSVNGAPGCGTARVFSQSSEETAAGVGLCEEFTWSLSRPCVQGYLVCGNTEEDVLSHLKTVTSLCAGICRRQLGAERVVSLPHEAGCALRAFASPSALCFQDPFVLLEHEEHPQQLLLPGCRFWWRGSEPDGSPRAGLAAPQQCFSRQAHGTLRLGHCRQQTEEERFGESWAGELLCPSCCSGQGGMCAWVSVWDASMQDRSAVCLGCADPAG